MKSKKQTTSMKKISPSNILGLPIYSILILISSLSTANGQSAEQEKVRIYEQSIDYYHQRKYELGLSSCNEAIKKYYSEGKIDSMYVNLKYMALVNSIYYGPSDTIFNSIEKLKEDTKKLYGQNHLEYISLDALYADFYAEKGDFESAGDQYYKVAENLAKLDNPPILKIADMKGNSASNYSLSNSKLDEALEIQLEVIELQRSHFQADHLDISRTLLNIGLTYAKKEDPNKAIEYTEESYSMKKRLNGSNSTKNLQAITNLLILYGRAGDLNRSIEYCDVGLEVAISNLGKMHPYVARLYTLKASALIEQKNYEGALIQLDKAEYINKNGTHPDLLTSIEYLNEKALILSKFGEYKKAEEIYKEAFILNDNGSEIDGLNGSFSEWVYFTTSDRLGNLYKSWYSINDNEALLDSAVHYQEMAFSYVESICEENPSNYQTYSDAFQPLTWSMAETHYLKSDLETAVSILERNKSLSFDIDFNNDEISFADVDQQNIAIAKSFSDSIFHYEKKLLSIPSDTSAIFVETLDTINQLRKKHTSIKETIKRQSPNYYAAKYGKKDYNINNVYSEIAEDEALIEYSVSDTMLGIYVITQNSLHASYVSADSLVDKVTSFYDRLIRKEQIKDEAKELYQLLLAPIEDYIPTDVQHLTIIPEWFLTSVPFEMLVDQETRMLERYNISYNNSFIQAVQSKKSNKKGIGKLALFTPDYSLQKDSKYENASLPEFAEMVRSGYYDLPGAKIEAESIQTMVGGTHFQGQNASKEKFLTEASDFSILHLAMHSEMDNKKPLYSSLLFSGTDTTDFEKLEAYELYNQKFNADLVVLSACSSGFDVYNKTEGLLGFAKAFAYSGVPSIVYSLWKVPDDATSHIMVNFYKYLKEGQRKDAALQNAKLAYLADDSIPESQKTPYFWAGFVASGNMSPIKLGSKSIPIWAYGIFIGCGLLFSFSKFSKRNKVE